MWGLNSVLTVSDAEFATKFANVEPELYLRFRREYSKLRTLQRIEAEGSSDPTEAAEAAGESQSDVSMVMPAQEQPAARDDTAAATPLNPPTWFGFPAAQQQKKMPPRRGLFRGKFQLSSKLHRLIP